MILTAMRAIQAHAMRNIAMATPAHGMIGLSLLARKPAILVNVTAQLMGTMASTTSQMYKI